MQENDDYGPIITGARNSYSLGDQVQLNCTSTKSTSESELLWELNGESSLSQKNTLVRHFSPMLFSDSSGIWRSGLQFDLEGHLMQPAPRPTTKPKMVLMPLPVRIRRQLQVRCLSSTTRLIEIGSDQIRLRATPPRRFELQHTSPDSLNVGSIKNPPSAYIWAKNISRKQNHCQLTKFCFSFRFRRQHPLANIHWRDCHRSLHCGHRTLYYSIHVLECMKINFFVFVILICLCI